MHPTELDALLEQIAAAEDAALAVLAHDPGDPEAAATLHRCVEDRRVVETWAGIVDDPTTYPGVRQLGEATLDQVASRYAGRGAPTLLPATRTGTPRPRTEEAP